ncbi:MAG: hypothetical protein AB8B93_18320 [Pseudomonadales bacterium]
MPAKHQTHTKTKTKTKTKTILVSAWFKMSLWALLMTVAHSAAGAAHTFDPADSAPGNMRFSWIHGSLSAKANQDVRIQVHRYNEHTYILRQNPAVHWEAPFMYLLFGNDSALLLDVGASAEAEHFPLRATVDAVIKRWQDANGKTNTGLLVVPLGDDVSQTQALDQFKDRSNTRIVRPTERAREQLLGLPSWPEQNTDLDLGGRILTLIPTPGLSAQALSIYDHWGDLLFTGNSFYPGRLVIRDFEAYRTSLKRLISLTEQQPVRWVMGGRIEMSAHPGMDYRLRANFRPMEHVLQLPSEQLAEAFDAVQLMNGRQDIRILNDFILMHGVGRGARDYGYPVFVPEQFRQVRLR